MLTRRQFAIAGGTFLLAAGSSAQSGQLFHSAEQAAANLKTVTLLAFGGVGFASVQSPGERYFNQILAVAPARALPLFEDVFAHGRPAAQCYALAGIRKLSPARVPDLLKTIADSQEPVQTAHGCILESATLGELAEQIARTGYA